MRNIQCPIKLMFTLLYLFFFIERYRNHLVLHSFPTRRSSDLIPRSAICLCKPRFSIIKMRCSAHGVPARREKDRRDRKSTRLNSSHTVISYAVFCLKKKNYSLVTPQRSDASDNNVDVNYIALF